MSANMWLPRRLVPKLVTGLVMGLVAGVGLGLGACDESRSGPATELATAVVSDTQRAAVRALLTQITAISTPPAHASTLLQAADVTPLLQLVAPPDLPFPAPSAPADISGELSDCLLTTGSAATLTECELGDHVIDGTWSLQYHAAHTELVDVFVIGPDHHGSLWIDARLTVAERVMEALPDMPPVKGIDGDVEISAMWAANDRDHALNASIRIDGLAIEPAADAALDPSDVVTMGQPSPCAVAGTITVHGSLSTGEQRRVTVWLGPGCHDIHIAR
jgi:hypothetical protein